MGSDLATKRRNPLYSARHEATDTATLKKAKGKASGVERQRIDFELTHRRLAGERMLRGSEQR